MKWFDMNVNHIDDLIDKNSFIRYVCLLSIEYNKDLDNIKSNI